MRAGIRLNLAAYIPELKIAADAVRRESSRRESTHKATDPSGPNSVPNLCIRLHRVSTPRTAVLAVPT